MRTVAREYAEALFMLAKENKKEEEYALQLNVIEKAFNEQMEYKTLLSSPSIPLSERICAIDSAFSGVLDKDVLSFLKLIVEKGRISSFSECVCEYDQLLSGLKNLLTAVVRCVTPLSEKQLTVLKEKLDKITSKNVLIEQVIDKDLLGGIIIEIDGKIIDGSLKNKLSEIKGVICK